VEKLDSPVEISHENEAAAQSSLNSYRTKMASNIGTMLMKELQWLNKNSDRKYSRHYFKIESYSSIINLFRGQSSRLL